MKKTNILAGILAITVSCCVGCSEKEALKTTEAPLVTEKNTVTENTDVTESTDVTEIDTVTETSTTETVSKSVPKDIKFDYSYGLSMLNPDLMSEMGKSREEIVAKYGITDNAPGTEFLNVDEGHGFYSIAVGELEDYGVIRIDSSSFKELFSNEESGITVEEIAEKYKFKLISVYFNEMHGCDTAEFFAAPYEISLINVKDGLITEDTFAEITNLDFFNLYKTDVSPEDFKNSFIKFYIGSSLGIAKGTTVSDFSNDPVIKQITSSFRLGDFHIEKNGELITSGEIDDTMVLKVKSEDNTYDVTWNFVYAD
jgi:hypothetical protein